MLKAITLFVLLIALVGSGVVATAAHVEATIHQRTTQSLEDGMTAQAVQMRRAALAVADEDVFHALAWHAGAMEAYAWNTALTAAAEGDQDAAQAAAALTAHSVALAPIAPAGWLRLSVYAADGLATPCTAQTCLSNSFISAPMGLYRSGFACGRLQLAIALGVVTSASDLKVRMVAADGLNDEQFVQCLRGLPLSEMVAGLAANQHLRATAAAAR